VKKVYEVKATILNEKKNEKFTFNIMAGDFILAVEESILWLQETLGKNTPFVIKSIKEKKKSVIANIEDDEDCDCPSCRYETAEEKINFTHQCGLEVKIAGDGWDLIECPKCHQEINRKNLYKTGDDGWKYDYYG